MDKDSFNYITELDNLRSRSQKQRKSKREILNDSIFKKNKISKLIESSKENFVNFMISNETKFAKLDQIEDESKLFLQAKSKEISNHFIVIEKRKKYLMELDIKLESAIKNSVTFTYDELTETKEMEVADLNNKM